MKIELNQNQAALVMTMGEDGESCNMRIVYDEENEDLFPMNIQMLFAIAELFQNDKDFMELIERTIRNIFKESTTH